MIFHIPHASLDIPVDLRSSLVLDDQALMDELRVMTDTYADDLFGGHAGDDDTVVTFPVSRLVVDPARFLDEMQEMMAWIGRGVIYTKTSGGNPLREYPALDERDALIRRFYVPHHKQLNEAAGCALRRHGTACVLDCQSFPSAPLPYELDQDPDRPDICVGTDPFHTPPELTEAVRQVVADEGLTCRINRPFDGCLIPSRFYETDKRVSGIMIKVNRSQYMDEATGERSARYESCREMMGRLIQKIRLVCLPDPRK